VQRIRAPIERTLRDARLQPADLQEVVLVGGASRMALMPRLVARMLGRLPLRHVNPDEAIARGACVAAGMKARNAALEEVVLTDVCPYTLGVEVSRDDAGDRRSDGHFAPIIERNMTVPVSRSEAFYPVDDGQRQLRLNVYQGESPLVARNVLLGTLDIPLPRKSRREECGFDVRFTYDVNGVLQVEATMQRTGQVFELLLQQPGGALGEAEIRERLARLAGLKVHPRQDQENIALIARVERLYEESLDDRALLQSWLAQFLATVDGQDRELIARHRAALEGELDAFEGSAR
jgi:molecular chaperone HscC